MSGHPSRRDRTRPDLLQLSQVIATPGPPDVLALQEFAMPRHTARPSRQTPALGFSIDLVGYSKRTPREREDLQARFRKLVEGALADLDLIFDEEVTYDRGGDRISAFLPAHTDPTHALPHLLAAIATRLADDNKAHPDRIRARMAVGFGLYGEGPTGFTGQLIIELSRLTEADVVRATLRDFPRSDLVVLISDGLYRLTIESGHLSPAPATLRRVHVEVKGFAADAWLWVGPTSGPAH